MKGKIKVLAVIFSVVLNIVFIGSYFYHKADLLPLTGRRTNYNRPLYEELHLNRQQLDRFMSGRDKFHAFINGQGRKIKARQLELIGLLAMDNPNRLMITAKKKKIQALQQQLQARVIGHLLEESRILTPRQRQKFFDLIKGRIKESNGPRPRWMPRTPAGPKNGKRSRG